MVRSCGEEVSEISGGGKRVEIAWPLLCRLLQIRFCMLSLQLDCARILHESLLVKKIW